MSDDGVGRRHRTSGATTAMQPRLGFGEPSFEGGYLFAKSGGVLRVCHFLPECHARASMRAEKRFGRASRRAAGCWGVKT